MQTHRFCKPKSCQMDCISTLDLHLNLYLDELSRVFFKKENLRTRNWWLSAFLSLCIQSLVRKALIALFADETPDRSHGAREYLRLPVRLFIASSGIHDPLMRDFALGCEPQVPEKKLPSSQDYKLAQIAIQKDAWSARNIKSSADYLKLLYEDDEKDITDASRITSKQLSSGKEEQFQSHSGDSQNLVMDEQLRNEIHEVSKVPSPKTQTSLRIHSNNALQKRLLRMIRAQKTELLRFQTKKVLPPTSTSIRSRERRYSG
jgi:hypothetical protein